MITASDNKQLKNVTLLMKDRRERKEQQTFVIEGPKMFKEAPEELIRSVYVSESFASSNDDIIQKFEAEIVSDKRFAAISDTKNPQGIIAVSAMPKWNRKDILEIKNPLFLVLENIQDPGNIGTMIRTAEAACVDAIFVSRGSVDIFNPKVIRSTMGSVYRIPVFTDEDMEILLGELKEKNVTSYAAHLDATESYFEKDFCKGTAIIIGNESNGITDATAEAAAEKIIIPMKAGANSLNAAMSAGILMYEVVRQRA